MDISVDLLRLPPPALYTRHHPLLQLDHHLHHGGRETGYRPCQVEDTLPPCGDALNSDVPTGWADGPAVTDWNTNRLFGRYRACITATAACPAYHSTGGPATAWWTVSDGYTHRTGRTGPVLQPFAGRGTLQADPIYPRLTCLTAGETDGDGDRVGHALDHAATATRRYTLQLHATHLALQAIPLLPPPPLWVVTHSVDLAGCWTPPFPTTNTTPTTDGRYPAPDDAGYYWAWAGAGLPVLRTLPVAAIICCPHVCERHYRCA